MPPHNAVKKAVTTKLAVALPPAPPLKVPDTGKQVFVAGLLWKARQTGLHQAVSNAAASIPAKTLRAEILAHAPGVGLTVLQGTSVRDEEVFATPSLLTAAPGALAYYRLLLGISQKQFYERVTGLNIFKAMEEAQRISPAARTRLSDLCKALNDAMTQLLHALPPGSLRLDVDQLPLMTLGAQADGAWRTRIGTSATAEVYNAMLSIVLASRRKVIAQTSASITVLNNSGREVVLTVAPDPDLVIREKFGTTYEYKAAIEIKGGTDYSNIHNRVGEAEKSHQKAMTDGAGTCWTVIHLAHANMAKLKQESPTTREWIDMADVVARSGPGWTRLQRISKAAMGI